MAANPYPPEVIDLLDTSSEDEDDDVVPLLPFMPRRQVQVDPADEDVVGEAALPMAGAFPVGNMVDEAPFALPAQERRIDGGMIIVIDGDEIFIPDEEPELPTPPTTTEDSGPELPPNNKEFTADDCLQHVLEIFPDISHDYVRGLFTAFDHESDYEVLAGRARLDNLVEQLVSSTSYPKQERGKLKRKREDSVGGPIDMKEWERADRAAVPNWAKGAIAAICKADFPAIPRAHINERMATHTYLFQTYLALAKDLDDTEEGARIYGKGRACKPTTADADTIALNCGHVELVEELIAVRLQVIAVRSQREAAKAKKRAEEENLQKAIADGETAECSACFDDLPMNRQIHCDGESAHFTCFDCAETYIKSEVGDDRCKVLCPSGCGAGFAYNQLNLLENKQLLEKLAQIQQERDIRDAGLDDLEECPFCDFKCIMPPIKEDFEFRCANPECEKVSCRRCKAISHIPMTCEQHAKDNKLSSRHLVEEAMTAALVRSCNKCKRQFIKESGCNKMHCQACNTLQCYVCSATVRDYNHFDQGGARGRTVGGAESKKCPLYDNVDQRHEREVKEAEAKARAEVVENNPDVSAEDLEIKVSDAVRKAESERAKQAGVGMGGMNHPYMAFGGAFRPHGQARALALAERDFGEVGDDEEDDDDDDDDEGGLADMLQVFGPRRVLGEARVRRRPDAAVRERQILQMQARQRELQDQLEGMRRQHAQRDAAAVANGRPDPQPLLYPAAPAPMQGYIPFYLGGGVQAAQVPQAQQPPQQPPAPQRPGAFAGLFDFADDFGMLGQNDPRQAPPPLPQQGQAAAQNNMPAADGAQQPALNPPWNRPAGGNNLFGRPPALNEHGFPPDHPYVPGAYPRPVARPRMAMPPQQAQPLLQVPNLPRHNQDLEVLRMQHEEMMRNRHRQLQEGREARLQAARARARERQAGLGVIGGPARPGQLDRLNAMAAERARRTY